MHSNRNIFILSKTISLFILCIISLVCGVYIFASIEYGNTYYSIFILPFSYTVGLTFSGKILSLLRKSVTSLILVIGYFVRMVVYPLIFCMGEYHSFFLSTPNSFDVIKAVLLLSLEWFAIVITANVCVQNTDCYYEEVSIEPQQYNIGYLKVMVCILFVFLIAVYEMIPALKTAYLFLPTADFKQLSSLTWNSDTIVQRGTSSRYLFTLFGFIWPIVRAVLPSLCISQIYKKHGENTFSLLLSTACLLIPALFLGEDNIGPLLGALIGLIVILRLYKRRGKYVISLFVAVFGLLAFTIITTKLLTLQAWRGASGVASIAQMVNAYFPGVDNIAFAFSINGTNRLQTLFFDLYSTIPFRETLFGLKGDNLTDLFAQTLSTNGQIVPWGYQIAHYTTIILSPFVTAIFTKIAFTAERKSKLTSDFWKYFINMYLSVFIPICFSCYSFTTFLRTLISVLLPVIIIIRLGNRKIVRK